MHLKKETLEINFFIFTYPTTNPTQPNLNSTQPKLT
jgi:hypothetical protein